MSAIAVEVVHAGEDRQPADELGDHAELEQVLRHHVGERVGGVDVGLGPDRRAEADALLAAALLDDLLQAGERSTDDEQHVRRVDLDELLVRVLASTLRRDRRGRALEDLQQRLLDALAGHVAGDRRVLALASDLVDLVDVDDPGLGLLDVVVRRLDQLEQDVLDVLADVPGLGERCRVGDGEGDVEHARERLGEQGLAAAGRPQQQDVRLGELDLLLAPPYVAAGLHPLVVVVDGDGQRLLRRLLPDDVAVEELVDLTGLGQLVPLQLGGLGQLLLDDLVAQVDALVADVHAGTGDELLDLLLALSAERALEQVTTVADASHRADLLRCEAAGDAADPGRLAAGLDISTVPRPCQDGTAIRWRVGPVRSQRTAPCTPVTRLPLGCRSARSVRPSRTPSGRR